MLSILTEIQTFYVLDALKYRTSAALDDTPEYKSHQKLRADVREARSKQENLLFRAMADYLSGICYGEARHSHEKCDYELLIDGDMRLPSHRTSAIFDALEFDPEEFLPVLEDLFEYSNWDGGYGGESWARLCRIAMKAWTGEWKKTTLIDHVTDLRHNNGLAFNKGVIFAVPGSGNERKLNKFLVDKRDRSIETWRSLVIPNSVWRLLWRAKQLGFIRQLPINTIPKCLGDIPYNRVPVNVNTIQEEGYEPWNWIGIPFEYTLEKRQILFCENCGEHIMEGEELRDDYGRIYCYYCYHELFVTCDVCQNECRKEDTTRVIVEANEFGEVAKIYCETCLDRIEEVTCANCGLKHLKEGSTAVKEIRGKFYCFKCAPEIEAQAKQGFIFLHYNSNLGYEVEITQREMVFAYNHTYVGHNWQHIRTIRNPLNKATAADFDKNRKEKKLYRNIMLQQEYNQVKRRLYKDMSKPGRVNPSVILRKQLMRFMDYVNGTPDPDHKLQWWNGRLPAYPEEISFVDLKQDYASNILGYLQELSWRARELDEDWAVKYCAKFNTLKVADLFGYLDIWDDVPLYFEEIK